MNSPQLKVSFLVNRSSRSCHGLHVLIKWLFLANHCQSILKTIQLQATESYLLRQWLSFEKKKKTESYTSAQCLSNLNSVYWNEIQILFSSSSLPSHHCCFRDARNDVCFRLRVLKWVDMFELEADSWWVRGFVLLKGTWWGALILLPFSPCCLSALTGGCWLSLPSLTCSHWQHTFLFTRAFTVSAQWSPCWLNIQTTDHELQGTVFFHHAL